MALKDDLFPERVWNVLFVIRFECGVWSHIISLISPSKCHLALIRATVITSFILISTKLVLRVEWNETVSDLSRSIRHQEIFEPQPGNFGRMDCALGWPQPQVFRGYFFNSCNFQGNVQAFRLTGLLRWQKLTWFSSIFFKICRFRSLILRRPRSFAATSLRLSPSPVWYTLCEVVFMTSEPFVNFHQSERMYHILRSVEFQNSQRDSESPLYSRWLL